MDAENIQEKELLGLCGLTKCKDEKEMIYKTDTH